MGKKKLYETYILKSALKCDPFDVTIGIKIPFFKSFGYYGARSLLTTVRYQELLEKNTMEKREKTTYCYWSSTFVIVNTRGSFGLLVPFGACFLLLVKYFSFSFISGIIIAQSVY